MTRFTSLGDIEGIGDDTGAYLVGKRGTKMQAAVDGRVNSAVVPLVAQAIADDDTVTLAAAAAVDDAMSDELLVRDDDDRLPVQTPVPAYLWMIVDENSRLAMGVRADGVVDIPQLNAGATAAVPWHVVIAAGQSNMSGVSRGPATGETDPHHPRVFQYGAAARNPGGNLSSGAPFLLHPDGSTGPSPAYDYAVAYADAHPGVNVCVIPCSYGSTGFTNPTRTWDRTNSGAAENLYDDMIMQTLDAVAAINLLGGTDVTVAALLWAQGDYDIPNLAALGGEAGYAAKLDDMIGAARTALASPNMVCVVGSMVPTEIERVTNTGGQAIDRAQRLLPARVERTAYVYGPRFGHQFGVNNHYSEQALRELGRSMFGATRRAIMNRSGVNPIDVSYVNVTRIGGGKARIEWGFPESWVTEFQVTIVEDGGTPTAVSLFSPVDTWVEVDTTASLLEVEVVTVNGNGSSISAKGRG